MDGSMEMQKSQSHPQWLNFSFVVEFYHLSEWHSEKLFTYLLYRCDIPATVTGRLQNDDSVCSQNAAKVTHQL